MSLERNTDPSILGDAGFVFQTPVRPKRARSNAMDGRGALLDMLAPKPSRRTRAALRAAKATIRSVTKKTPEVMVKVSGSVKGRYHLREHFAYLTRNGKILAEKSDGEILSGSDAMQELADDWWAMGAGKRRDHAARETVNMVFSMPAGTDPLAVQDAVRAFAEKAFAGHDYIMVLHSEHTDPSKNRKPHPHVHLTVRSLGREGQCIDPKKADLQAWREGFARQLRIRGVEAAATPRRARGVIDKGESHVSRSIREDDKIKGARRSKVNAWRVQQAIKTLQPGTSPGNEAWRSRSAQRQAKIRRAWGQIAYALDQAGDVALAAQVRAFVSDMPPIGRFKHETMAHEARASLELLRKSNSVLEPELRAQQDRDRRR